LKDRHKNVYPFPHIIYRGGRLVGFRLGLLVGFMYLITY
jgi:hypothetical protein